MATTETLNTSTPKAPSRHREFFEKLYGSLETKSNQKLDSSSSSDESIIIENRSLKESSDSSGNQTVEEKNEEKSSPLRPFPSFPVPASLEQNRFLGVPVSGSSNVPGFPYLPHHFGSNSAASAAESAAAAASVEAALRLPDFPFPGGLAAFRKFSFYILEKTG